MLAVLGGQIATLDAQIAALETQMRAAHKANPLSRLLEQIPGIGPISALSLALTIDPAQFRSGRHLAAALGLTPREHSTGGKQRMGGISRAGDERLRRLLVVGATAVIRQAAAGRGKASAWLLNLLQRGPRKGVAVALANKMARVAWAMMTTARPIGRRKPHRDWGPTARRCRGDKRCKSNEMTIGRTDEPDHPVGSNGASTPCPCLGLVRGSHLGQRPGAASTGRTHDRTRSELSDFRSKTPCIRGAVHTWNPSVSASPFPATGSSRRAPAGNPSGSSSCRRDSSTSTDTPAA